MSKKKIKVESSSVAIFKPLVERTNDSIQRFFPIHFKNLGIKTAADFNKNKEVLINDFHQWNNKFYAHKQNIFRTCDTSKNEHKVYLEIKRKAYASTFQYQNQYYVAVNEKGQKLKIWPDDDARIMIDSKGEIKISINNIIFSTLILKGDELNDFQKFCLQYKISSTEIFSKPMYKLFKNSRIFANNLYNVIHKLEEKI
ncbi:hypothetical protein [Mycoplasma zalophi]|uniref:hypothetical protein n=1 Tax=Mycoplasma zalophi TaxID=191287 RepID=UPI001C102D9F|nr:hypothetical protein [Mycoplasma zalophi]MBU4690832.1 hypothetical protein [Mycoplasma zalophi]